MKPQKKTNLIEASRKVLALAQERRERMKASPSAKPTKASAKAVAPAKPADKKAIRKVAAAGKTDLAESTELKPTGPDTDVGEEDLGVHIPPEVASLVEEGKEDGGDDDLYQPGIMIPPGLEDAVSAVADPSKLTGESIRFDLVPFAPAQGTPPHEIMSAGAHWVLFANGEPLARVDLKDQPHAERIAGHFITQDYAHGVLDGLNTHGIKHTLETIKAKPYVAVVDERAKIKDIKARLEAQFEEKKRASLATIKSSFMESMDLVLEASANNFIIDNELKDYLIASFATSLGTDEEHCARLIDEAFFAKGRSTIKAFLDKSEEWTHMAPSARKELSGSVMAAGRVRRPLPSVLGPTHSNPQFNHALAARMAAAGVPVTPTTSEGAQVQAQPNAVSGSVRMNAPTGAQSADGKAAYRARFGSLR